MIKKIKKTILNTAIVSLLSFNIFSANTAESAVWQIISSESNKRIELDTSLLRKDGDYTETLGRVVFYKPLKDLKSGEEYRMIEAVTRYNCGKRTASTVKRIYRRNETSVLREELLNANELPVRAGTLDDKMLNQVCKIANIPTNNPSPIAATASNENTASQNNSNSEKTDKVEKTDKKETKKSKKELAKEKQEKEKLAKNEKKEVKENNDKKENTEIKENKENKEKENKNKKETKKTDKADKAEQKTDKKDNKNNDKKFDESLPLLPTVEVIKNNNANAFVAKKVDWGYNGMNSPAHWADIKPEYKICRNGLRQSPIDVRGSVIGDLENLKFNYRQTTFNIVDTGYTIRIELNNGGTLYYDNKAWLLKALEFRIPGEEMINGKRGEMSVQLQHQTANGEMLIVSVQLNSGAENQVIQKIWNNMPLERNGKLPAAIPKEINVTDLLPSNTGYLTYMGSLTVPPCTENVQWIVLRNPQTISAEQIRSFGYLYRNNARPIQADNGRIIKESR